jgi:hypothetical protein
VPNLRISTFALAVTLLSAACAASAPSSGVTSSAGPGATPTANPAVSGASPSDASPTFAPSPTDTPTTTDEPSPTDQPTATDEPSPTRSQASATPSPETGAAVSCSGSDQNRQFYADIAGNVDWPVLCAVLPKGWFVGEGRYRLANGGWLRIGYKGPGGATLWLHQGASCVTNGGCEPSGTDLGSAQLGPLEGTLYEMDDGFAILVAPGENPSWYLTTSGLDQATTEALAAKVVQVGG